jgi:hypothetical protein
MELRSSLSTDENMLYCSSSLSDARPLPLPPSRRTSQSLASISSPLLGISSTLLAIGLSTSFPSVPLSLLDSTPSSAFLPTPGAKLGCRGGEGGDGILPPIRMSRRVLLGVIGGERTVGGVVRVTRERRETVSRGLEVVRRRFGGGVDCLTFPELLLLVEGRDTSLDEP